MCHLVRRGIRLVVILIAISLYLHETSRLGRCNWTTLAANQLTDRYKDTSSLQGRNFLRQCGGGGSIDFCAGGIPSSIQYSVPNGWKCKEEMPYCPAPNCVHRCHVHCHSLLRKTIGMFAQKYSMSMKVHISNSILSQT